jgi:REP element-mobilizing transposase RayT
MLNQWATSMSKFQNKYRNESARAQWWDYGWNGAYFITICTKNREHFFGEIRNGKMELLPLGVIADILWHEIPNHASFVELGDFVVMPNHIHGILILDKPEGAFVGTVDGPVVGTGHALSRQPADETPIAPTIGQNRFQNIGKNTVSSIIGSYKSAVTKHANRLGFENGWQSRFHDHIIRNDAEYQRISDYINNNPANWSNDKFCTV